MMIECVCCGWVGSDTELIMPFSDSEASCPICSNDNFVDLDGNYVPPNLSNFFGFFYNTPVEKIEY